MADTKPSTPRLASVADAGPVVDPPAAPAASPTPAHRRPAFWLLVAVALAAVAGFAMQTERVRALETTNATLAGQLFSARSALGAYTERFAVVRDTVAGLHAQLAALSDLVSEDPVPSEEPSPAESGTPAGAAATRD